MNNTWGFRSDDHDWKSEKALLHTLVDIASKGGNLLLNVGPTAEGEIPVPSLERLAAMGRWMDVNAESIRGTSASPFRALRWGRVTTRTDAKGTTLFLHVFAWPKAASTEASSTLLLPGLRTGATRASLLADAGTTLETRQTADGLEVIIPASLTAPDPVVSVIRLELVGPPVVEELAIAPTQDGLFLLGPLDATTAAHGPKVEERGGGINLGLWTHKQAAAAWTIRVDKPGRFKVELLTSSLRAGHRAVIEVQDQKLLANIPQTDSWDAYVVSSPGEITFTKPGNHTLRVAADGPFEVGLMNLRQLRLIPVPGSTP